jgi:hypothetical protein
MAKTHLLKNEISEVEKLTSEELKILVDVQQKINNITLNLGNAELAKQAMFVHYNEIKAEWDVIAKSMEDKYGQVNVNLSDGTISAIDSSTDSLV